MGKLIKDDSFLFDAAVNERSITHCLAIYLADQFPEYDIDCEYNRMLKDGQQVRKSAVRIKEVLTDDLDAQTVYPDIIVHWREDDTHNLLVIEAKKLGPQFNPYEDFEKLNGFMELKANKGLGYQFSAFVIFDIKNPTASQVEVKQAGEKWEGRATY
jgi:hypothetical protein